MRLAFRLAIYIVTISLQLCPQVETGRIVGLVIDTSGAAIPTAPVTVKNEKTGETRKVTSNESGAYTVANLPPASYSLDSASGGLGPALYKGIQIAVGQDRTVNLILQPATVNQGVTVSGGELTVIGVSPARLGADTNEPA